MWEEIEARIEDFFKLNAAYKYPMFYAYIHEEYDLILSETKTMK